LFCDAAIDFLQNHDAAKPFFTYISFMAPHDPRSMPKVFRDMYPPYEIDLPENFMSVHPVEYGNAAIRDEVLAGYPRKPDEIRRHIAEYYAMITHLDNEIGRVLDTLRERGMYENTIIIFAADNGLAVGQHGLMGKQNHFEHSIRVPLIVAGPGIPHGEKRDAYVYLLDIFPTLCDLIEIDTPETVDGLSFAQALSEPNAAIRNELYFAYVDKIRSVKNDRYKLMEFMHEGQRTTLLFDVIEDPLELANLAGRSDAVPVIAELRKRMMSFRDSWDEEKSRFGKSFWDGYLASES
jgi:arylsulfatase A-like enzyme